MKLYYTPSACSLAVHIILREGNYDFDLESVDLKQKKTETGKDFLTINPLGYVPVLEIDSGQTLTEVAVILQYLGDKASKNLIPSFGSFERYQLLMWLQFISTEIHKAFGPLFKDETPEEFKNTSKQNILKKFEYLDKHLASNDYVFNQQFTIADAYLFVTLRWAFHFKMDLQAYPNLYAYFRRIDKRESVQDTLAAENKKKG
ncbi:MAG TPA: glutathione transferase GstA [Gammaproteobacteria bacterium]|nr:glutathione transferase GstA [Gammaproteobacteria bacterium]